MGARSHLGSESHSEIKAFLLQRTILDPKRIFVLNMTNIEEVGRFRVKGYNSYHAGLTETGFNLLCQDCQDKSRKTTGLMLILQSRSINVHTNDLTQTEKASVSAADG